MPTEQDSKSQSGEPTAAEHVAAASQLLKTLQAKLGQHPEIQEAVTRLEMALASLGVQTGGFL
ncbi:MAG: hypothetical protein WBV46_14820 [Terriglobales bacterium]|jgi:hypothetical protein